MLKRQSIGIIILAAGSSQRFQGDKRQAHLSNGKSLLQNTLNNIPNSFEKKLLVLHQGDELLAEKFSAQGWDICIAENSQHGMGLSLSSAVHRFKKCEGLVIGLGDMPFILPKTYAAIQTAVLENEIVTPVFEGKRGNPIGFQAKYFDCLMALTGDKGARNLLQENAKYCYPLAVEDDGILKDIDTREILASYS